MSDFMKRQGTGKPADQTDELEDQELERLRARASLATPPSLKDAAEEANKPEGEEEEGCCSGKPETDPNERAEQARREEKARMTRVDNRDERLTKVGRAHHTKGRM